MIMVIDPTIALAIFKSVPELFTRLAFGDGFHIMGPWVYDNLNVDWTTPSVFKFTERIPSTIIAKSEYP